jgi:predicted component of type VI protein secretion system
MLWRCAKIENGDKSNLCAAPEGPFRQIVLIPFSDEPAASSSFLGGDMKLKLISGDPNAPAIVLDQFPVIVGLDPGADVCLDDSSVGHYQCMIDYSDGLLMVWDLGTKAGTFINGTRVSPKSPLQHGDEITFGKSRFTAECDGAAKPSRSGAPAAHRREPTLAGR